MRRTQCRYGGDLVLEVQQGERGEQQKAGDSEQNRARRMEELLGSNQKKLWHMIRFHTCPAYILNLAMEPSYITHTQTNKQPCLSFPTIYLIREGVDVICLHTTIVNGHN